MVNSTLRAAGPDTRRGLAAGSCTEVQSADVGNCTGTRCTGQRHDMRAIGSDIEYGGLARSSGQRRTIRPSSYRSKFRSGLPNAGAYASSASWRTGWMYSCCRDPNGRPPGRQEYGCGGHVYGLLDQRRLVVVIHRPAHNGLGVAVDDGGQIYPAFPGFDIRDVTDHFQAGSGRGEVALDEVGDAVLLA